MPPSDGSPQQQFAAVDDLLTRWLKERREVLTSYAEMAMATDIDIRSDAVKQRQQSLCELLVDYVSAGHFEVFHQLIREAESFADGSDTLATALIPSIGDTTEVILAYDEKHSGDEDYATTLKRDLSALGEVLESRFVLEDKLIAGLHSIHRR